VDHRDPHFDPVLWAAVDGAGAEAGRDAWRGLKRLITDLYETRRSSQAPQGEVSIEDAETKVKIALPPNLPDQAYRILIEIGNPSAPLSGMLRWDNDAQDWVGGQYRCRS